MRTRLLALLAILLIALALPAVAAPGATTPPGVTDPSGDQQQITAQRPAPVPPTRSCTTQIMSHTFANSYYRPFTGSVSPPTACPGPWSDVVLTFTASVSKVQFDRTLDITVGGAELLRGSTSEPCCTGTNSVSWSVQRDVTQEQALLQQPDQPVLVALDNVNDATYTGQYATTASLTYYQPDATHPAATSPDVVLPVTALTPTTTAPSGNEPLFSLGSVGQSQGAAVTFPHNLARLTAELFGDGHGACEEFWWSEPSGCGAGNPYREVAISIDGQLAGAAPVFPTTFTGADGPGFWEPIPSPRAWDLRPYDVDLTPFVATLTDGKPHAVLISVLDPAYTRRGGAYWQVAATLLGSVQHDTAVTTGALTTASAPTTIDDTGNDPTGQDVAYSGTTSHVLDHVGHIDTPSGPVTTAVHESMGETASQPADATTGSWHWSNTTSTTAGGHTTVADDEQTYGLTTTPLSSFAFVDDETTSTSVDGVRRASSARTERMRTSAAGLAYNGVELEDSGASDSTGLCYHRTIATAAGQVPVDTSDSACPATAPTDAGPAASLPEAPYAALLLLVALPVGALALRRRRR